MLKGSVTAKITENSHLIQYLAEVVLSLFCDTNILSSFFFDVIS